jgi:hypothetical protein
MVRQRYIVVEHPRETETLHLIDKRLGGVLPVHTLLTQYHWARLDDIHVVVIGGYGLPASNKLSAHPSVTVLPSLNSTRTIHAHCVKCGKLAHFNALAPQLGLTQTSTMGDFVDSIAERYGPVFSSGI